MRTALEQNPFGIAMYFNPAGGCRLDTEHDVVVVGANVAGASVARHLAERGLRVGLVERQSGPEVGSKSCGDGIERFQFERLGLPTPKGEFVLREVDVAYLLSPDRASRFLGAGAGIAIDRFSLNQHLLARAFQAGVELHDRVEALGPVVEEGAVTGVRVEGRDGAPGGLAVEASAGSSGGAGVAPEATGGAADEETSTGGQTARGDGEGAAPTRVPAARDPDRQAIYALADAGKAPVEIAQATGRPPGEVELVLALRGQPRRPAQVRRIPPSG